LEYTFSGRWAKNPIFAKEGDELKVDITMADVGEKIKEETCHVSRSDPNSGPNSYCNISMSGSKVDADPKKAKFTIGNVELECSFLRKIRPELISSVIRHLDLGEEFLINTQITAKTPGDIVVIKVLSSEGAYDVFEIKTGEERQLKAGQILVGALVHRDRNT